MDLESQVQQDIFQQFDLRVDPLQRDSYLPVTQGLQIIKFVLFHLIDLGWLVHIIDVDFFESSFLHLFVEIWKKFIQV